jgi:predicted Zn-dependent protease
MAPHVGSFVPTVSVLGVGRRPVATSGCRRKAVLTRNAGAPNFTTMSRSTRRFPVRTVAALLLALALPPSFAQSTRPAPGQAGADGVTLGPPSRATSLASAREVETRATTEYRKVLQEAASKRALAPADHPQLKRLRGIADRLIPHAARFNERARDWKWEVNLIGSSQINAWCMPGGKIAFYTGILDTLKLTDDEIATVMGHEIAHALREHGRERVGQARIAQGVTMGASIASQMLGFGDLGGYLASGAAQLTMLKFGRDDETEADLVGMDVAARAGYDPRAGVVLWQKMAAASKGQPPQWLSTHPNHGTRIDEIRRNLEKVMPVYARAVGKPVSALGPYRSNVGDPVP